MNVDNQVKFSKYGRAASFMMLYKKTLTQMATDGNLGQGSYGDVEKEIVRTDGMTIDDSLETFAL